MNKKVRPKVVLIEDEKTLASLVSNKLEKNGYEIVTSHDGEEGLKLIESANPDVVVLDMMLPSKNGFEILRSLHERGITPALPVLIVSNSGQPIEIEEVKKLGAKDYLIKVNFTPDELLAKVQTLCRATSSGGKDEKKQAEYKQNTKRANKKEVFQENEKVVLLIEDDFFLSDILSKKLSNSFIVYKAADAGSARTLLGKNNIHAICLDIVLPDTDGFTFLEELKKSKEYKHIPVLIISNLGQQEEIKKGLSLGAADYIVKAHSTPQEIAERVLSIINKKSRSLRVQHANSA